MISKTYWILTAAILAVVVANSIYNAEEFQDQFEGEDDNENAIGEHGEREGRILFPFVSIVRFANTECSSTNTNNGTCLARRECNNLNGTITGNCASRRGRCCVVSRGCGGTTNVNNTYFTSPGYPAAYAGGQGCSLIVRRCNSNICQLRIDFSDFVLSQPNGDGVCSIDSIAITGGNTVVPLLCGDLTGQTIYVDFNADGTPITITITATLTTTFSRRWNIKLTQLSCDCPGLAPNGCLQYYTGITGTITSFNYGTAANTALSASLVTGTRQIVNLNYGVCIRMEAGYCGITYAQTADVFSFTVTGDVEGADNTVLGTTVGAVNGVACVTDFVVIPNPVVVATAVAATTDRFCGIGFVSVTSGVKPFVLTVVTDASEGATATTPPDVANRGFTLTYTQVAC